MNPDILFSRIIDEVHEHQISFHRICADTLLWQAPVPTASEKVSFHLSTDEHRRLESYLHTSDQYRFALGRSSVRQIFSVLLNIRPEEVSIEIGRNGKPLIKNDGAEEFSWNLSHSGHWVVGVLSHQRSCGIDIEEIRTIPDWEVLCREFLSSQDSLWPCLDLATFFKAWTGKEAFSKMTGLGLSLPLHEITLFDSRAAWKAITARLSWFDICPNYVVCVASW